MEKQEKMTKVKCEGGRIFYASDYSKEEVVQKLGLVEHRSEELIGAVCDHICFFLREVEDQEVMTELCDMCPLSRLGELLGV